PAREKVTELKFAVADLGSNIQELLRKAEGIASLEKGFGQDRIQAAPQAHAHAILAAIGPDHGVPKDRIRVGWYVSQKERRHLERTPAQAVAHVDTEILQGSMIRSVVQRSYCRGVSTNVLMRGPTHVFPGNVGQRYFHGQSVGKRKIRVQNHAIREHVAGIQSAAIGEGMQSIETVLV